MSAIIDNTAEWVAYELIQGSDATDASKDAFWAPGESVVEGDMRYLPGKENVGYILKCSQAGMTSDTQPVINKNDLMSDLTDGTAKWEVIVFSKSGGGNKDWIANEEVAVGDVRYFTGRDNVEYFMECIQGGVTGATEPSPEDDNIVTNANYLTLDSIGHTRVIFSKQEMEFYEIPADGGTYSKSTYSELWDWALNHGLVLNKNAWDEMLFENDGKFVPYYCDYSSTMFLTPVYNAYPCLTDGSKYDVGTYETEGLPSPDLDFYYRQDTSAGTNEGVPVDSNEYGPDGYTGTKLSNTGGTDEFMFSSNYWGEYKPYVVKVNNSVYGNSANIRPFTCYAQVVIVAKNMANNTGSLDIADYAQQAVEAAQRTNFKIKWFN